MVCYRLVHWYWTFSDHMEGTRGCPTWSTSHPQRTRSSTAASGLGSPRSTSPFLRPRGAPTSPTARMWSHVSVRSCAFTNMAQSQEQVHTVAAQVRTSIERSCINSQDAFYWCSNYTKGVRGPALQCKYRMVQSIHSIASEDGWISSLKKFMKPAAQSKTRPCFTQAALISSVPHNAWQMNVQPNYDT